MVKAVACLIGVLVLAACTPQPGAPGTPPVVQPSPAQIAASLANAAVEAALAESLKPGATRATIVEAGYNAAVQQAIVLAPHLVADPVWGQSIRTAITLALVLSKDKGVLVLNESKARSECENATLNHIER